MGDRPKRKNKPGQGRKKKPIIPKDFEMMCRLQCTKQEMADYLDCSTSKIEKWVKSEYGDNFSNVYKRYTAGGKISLRRAMFRNALEKDNVGIQIWLSKQHLGMRDKQELDVNVKPYVIESPDGKEVIKLGVDEVEQIEGEIDEQAIAQAEQNYYDAEIVDSEGFEDEPTEE